MPPIAGPAIAPACHAVELKAIALGRISRGTRLGASAPSAGPAKARATPSRAATPNRIGRLMNPPQVAAEQDQGAQQFERDDGARDDPAVEPVGGPAADRRQHEQGHELDEPDEAELERRLAYAHRLARDVVDLPADDDDHRHLRDGRGQPRQPERAVIGDAQRGGDHALRPSHASPWPQSRPARLP